MSVGLDEADGSFTMRFQAYALRLLPPDMVGTAVQTGRRTGEEGINLTLK